MKINLPSLKGFLKTVLVILFTLMPFLGYSQFITTWKTDNPGETNDDQIEIPTFSGETYNYSVDWGDGSPNDTGITGNITHTYAVAGTYTVSISGTFPRIYFNGAGFGGDDTDYEKILTVEQWGNIAWESMANAFAGCSNLRINALDAPNFSFCHDLTEMFRGCSSLNADLSSWGTEVRNVELFNGMFREASSFNGDITNWDVGFAEEMNEMFFFASSFNQDIGGWQTGFVYNMSLMFAGATVFDQDIKFESGGGNQGGDAWDVSGVNEMDQMFAGAAAFNQPIGNWDVSNVNVIRSMFSSAHSFNQNISAWDISGVNDMSGLFRDATDFNQDLSSWNVINVLSMNSMFANTTYNQGISSWNVDNVQDFNSTFENNTAFNQDISGWNTASATDMRSMFKGAITFNQNLGGWNVSNITSFGGMYGMLDNSGLSVDNYDNTLIGWSLQTVNSGIQLGAQGLFYCAASIARQEIISNFGWIINDAGSGCINVYEGNTTTGPQIFNAQPEVIDFGSIDLFGAKSVDFTIENRLAVDITNFNATVSGIFFSIAPPPTTITPGSPLVIAVDFTGLTAPASITETVTLSYNPIPGLANTFTFTITGEVTSNPEPEIAIFEGNTVNGNAILSGTSTFYMENQLRGTDGIGEITITNKGSAPLTVTSLSIPEPFTVPTNGFTIPVDGTQTITITLDGTVAGFYSEIITIANNDNNGNENPFTFTVEGNILGPEIGVIDGVDIYNDPQIFSGQGYVVDLGTGIAGTDIIKQIVIINTGPVDLSVLDIDITSTGFSIVPAPTYPITVPALVDGIPGADTLDIVLSGTTPGTFSASVSITSDDDAIPTFNFGLTGNIIDPNAPKVYWTDNLQINRSSLDGSGFQQYHTESAYSPRGIEVDTLNKVIYWTNNWGQIRKGDIGATGLVNVMDFMNDGIDTFREMKGLALDIDGGKIYWISAYDSTIRSADLSSNDPANVSTTTVVTGLNNPIGIAIDPAAGLMYYTENVLNASTGDNIASLHRVNMDGTNDNILASETMAGQLYTYNDVVINPTDNSIYWTASNNDIFLPIGDIFKADLADVAGTTVSIPNASPNLPYGIDLDIENESIYWTDLNEYMNFIPATVNVINIDGSSKIVLQSNFPNLNYPLFIALDISVPVCQDSPTADAGQDVFIYSTDSVNLSGSVGGGATSSLWTTSGDGIFSDANLTNAIYTPGTGDIASELVTLTLTANAANCTPAVDQMVVEISLPVTVVDHIEVYNAVSPNGDGRHDFLEFKYIEAYPENQVKIFSRWGDIVFEIDGYNNVDKIFVGEASIGGAKELPTGTYYYTVVLKLPTGKFQTVKGYFELRR